MLASLVHARHAEPPVSPGGPDPRGVPAVSPGPAMALEPEALLDLSFLTEQERSSIAEVLRRDWQLRRREQGRISKLRKSVSDPARLRSLTGDWFCDARAQRHQQRQLGSDLVRASIRRRRRPRGTGGLERGPSLGELEAIDEPLAEEKEDEDGALETDESSPPEEVQEAPEPQPGPPGPAEEGTAMSQALLQGDILLREQDSPAQTGESGAGSGFGSSSTEEDEEEPDSAHAAGQRPETPETDQTPPAPLSPQNGHTPPSLLSTSSSVSSLSSSTLSGSLMSLYSEGELGRVAVRGCVQFSLRYDPARKELQVHVLRCRELAQARKERSDPYIKTYLLPDKSNHSKRKTAVRKRSLDPVFNETLKYKLEKRDLQGRTLNLSVWHHDSLGRNLFLGEVEVALGSWDWANTRPEWFSLQPRTPIPSDGLASRGSLNLALKFLPAGSEGGGMPPTGELHIWVKDAQSLIPLQSGTVDAFVQCYVLPDDSKASRQKTRVVKRSLSPLFNHTMVYDGFQAKDLAEACAEFTLWHHETFSKRQLGGIRLSLGTGSSYGLPVGWMDSTQEEQGVWKQLLQQPGQWVEALLPLRTNLVPRV
ncbi:synaptotagmin-like protein 1 isoform X1 [Poecile atricapillus]|uniref:synaptotagmin-like protein 1 isoform X1 n=1 Tax=Poecile atricapillus TaxID=48891 RepID=UPI002738CD04|nr:synaptotagmin-like protein 1 isoform X1 [Poecile atricapillus]XP_058712671.1 synaptotagmin-like protein 1 isoform X1 [Poecile atricapillus]XP_058712672.1 synaptotagmin-like protein 1 isoform X1 [Poecile atricapillus]XP_058712673.1 synaptotagmin-like protein 1 isoform X1 [Poecile atricapillus]